MTADNARKSLMAAGAAALEHNSPICADRVAHLCAVAADAGTSTIVDLGCGRGAFLSALATGLGHVTGRGIDSDEAAIRDAESRAEAKGVSSQLRFEVGDAAAWSGQADLAVAIGVSHVFGGPELLPAHVFDNTTADMAIIGDTIWQAKPSEWCLEAFGPMPDGIEELEHIATTAGWSVVDSSTSSQKEWDDFETTWTDGVRSLGTEAALTFASQRHEDYSLYRGTLGFGWLFLKRPDVIDG